MTSLIIRNGLVVDPSQNLERVTSIRIDDGKVTALGDGLPVQDATVIDASELIVCPGFIDLHAHLREPGREDKETIETGSRAAAAGGFTSVCAMPNTTPVNDNGSVTKYVLERGAEAGLVNVFPIGAITRGSRGEELADYGEMKDAGIVALSDDGKPVANSQVMRHAFEYARDFDLPIVDHCEEPALAAGGSMHEGTFSAMLGLKGINRLAEELHVVRDALLARETGGRVHIAHISTRGSVEIVRWAKSQGLPVTCEVTPHHLLLTDAAVVGFDTNAKMNPPLRSEEDRQALIEGLVDGTIDAIATDHAPHHIDEKMLEFDKAPFGVVGLETAVGLIYDRFVKTGVISLSRFVALFSTAPAQIFQLNRGALTPGSIADLTIVDPKKEWTVDPSRFQSKSRNTPFVAWTLTAAPVTTILGGVVVHTVYPHSENACPRKNF